MLDPIFVIVIFGVLFVMVSCAVAGLCKMWSETDSTCAAADMNLLQLATAKGTVSTLVVWRAQDRFEEE